MEPKTRIELVTSPLPRGCTTSVLLGPSFIGIGFLRWNFTLRLRFASPSLAIRRSCLLSSAADGSSPPLLRFALSFGFYTWLNRPDSCLIVCIHHHHRIFLPPSPLKKIWAELGSNQRRLSPTSLQPVSFSHSDIRP